MSITIYDGLRAARSTEIFTLAEQVRSLLEPVLFARLDEAVALRTGTELTQDPLRLADEVDALFHQRIHTLDPLDVQYSVSLLPAPGRRPLAIVRSENPQPYIDTLLDQGVMLDCCYYDNSDRPEDVSAAGWAGRKKLWGSALSRPGAEPFSGAPAECGLLLEGPTRYLIYRHLCERRRAERQQREQKG